MSVNQIPASEIGVGDVIQVEDWPAPAGVKGIHIVFHMDNNMDLVVEPTKKMMVME